MKSTTMTTVTETTSIQRNKDIKPFYTSRELAGLLNVSDQTVLNYHSKGYMNFPRGIKVGCQWRWNPKDIDAWIEHYNENRAKFEQERKNTKKSAQEDEPEIIIGIGKVNHEMKNEEKKKPARIEDFAPEMFDLLSRIAKACKCNSSEEKEDKDVAEIDAFMRKIMGLI